MKQFKYGEEKKLGKGKKVEAGQFNREKTVDATTASG
jgi:hypothetical protein